MIRHLSVTLDQTPKTPRQNLTPEIQMKSTSWRKAPRFRPSAFLLIASIWLTTCMDLMVFEVRGGLSDVGVRTAGFWGFRVWERIWDARCRTHALGFGQRRGAHCPADGLENGPEQRKHLVWACRALEPCATVMCPEVQSLVAPVIF